MHGSYSFSESGDHYTVCLGGKCFDMMPTNPNKSTVFEFSDNYYKAFRNGVELTHESVISEDISECLVSSNYGTWYLPGMSNLDEIGYYFFKISDLKTFVSYFTLVNLHQYENLGSGNCFVNVCKD